MKQSVSVIIPVYKKKQMFLEHLEHNMPYLKDFEVIVVDDASQQNIAEAVHDLFPDVQVIEKKENTGFAPTVNVGCNAAQNEYLMLLNSDVKLQKSFPKNMLKAFAKDDELFAVSFKQIEKDGGFVGKNRIFFKNGFPEHEKTNNMDSGKNAWAEGGSCIIRKTHFDLLGGFDEMYAPFYWEDIDLSYRAYSRGWHVKFDEDIVVEHHHESTIGSFFKAPRVRSIAFRNQLLFTWGNMTGEYYMREHIYRLPYVLFASFIKGQWSYLRGFFAALLRLPQAIRHRMGKDKHARRTDYDIFRIFREMK